MAEIETVKIQDGKDFLVINASDFDAKEHRLFTETKESEEAPEPPTKKAKK